MDTKEERKKEIFSKSIQLMHLKGYNATGIKDITDAIGISKSTFYNYFESKEDYAVEAIRYYYDSLAFFYKPLRDEKLAPLDRIRTFFKNTHKVMKKVGVDKGCFVGNLSEEVGGVNSKIAQEANAFLLKVEGMFYNNLKLARESGELQHSLDDKTLAVMLNSILQGTTLRAKVAGDVNVFKSLIVFIDDLLK